MRFIILILVCAAQIAFARGRSKDLGLTFGRFPQGKYNALTDVKGVRVGQVTLKSGSGKLIAGKGPVRTGVTVILPVEDDIWNSKVAAGSFVLNGNGEATGLMWLQESGLIETPIALTNTLNIANVQKGLVDWMLKDHPLVGTEDDTLTPVVLECDDSILNDIRGQHVKPEHVIEAIKKAKGGAIEEGAVGAGTGMMSYEFKAGIGTASRLVKIEDKTYTLGVLVNANHGKRNTLRIKGAPIGEEITDLKPSSFQDGSIIVIIATDAPLDGRQLSRLAKRVMLGAARTGAIARHGSGDVAIAFSTTVRIPHYPKKPLVENKLLSDFWIDDLFEAATDASEESVVNSLLAAETTVGRDGMTVHQIPVDRLKTLLKKYSAIK